ncbi:hypothetical protein AAG906_000347 [Vitis piasezkii]
MKDPRTLRYLKSIERQWVHIFLLDWMDQSKTNHPKIDPNIDKSTFKCTHCNKIGHTKSRCFEIVGYPDWWDHNRDQQKKDSKKISTVVVVEIKTEANVPEKASALVAAIDYGVNQKTGELDMSGTTLEPSSNDHLEIEEMIEEGRDKTIEPSPPSEQFGFEDVFTEILNQLSFVEGVLNLEPDPFMKRLPHRHNRGIPKPTYEPELSTKVKYPMSNYVSNHRFSESNKSFVNQLSHLLANPRWKSVMNEEMKSLRRMKHGNS